MTTVPAQQQMPYFDEGNPWRGSQLPCALVTGLYNGPAGQKAVVTVRQPGFTGTVLLDKDDLEKWIETLSTLRGQMSGLIIPPSGG